MGGKWFLEKFKIGRGSWAKKLIKLGTIDWSIP
jgi:hypothetical protein